MDSSHNVHRPIHSKSRNRSMNFHQGNERIWVLHWNLPRNMSKIKIETEFYTRCYHRLHWYATSEFKTLAEKFPRFLACYQMIYRIEVHRSQSQVWPSDLLYFMLAGCDWWISIRFGDNMYDWRTSWKCFRWCFDFWSHLSVQTGGNALERINKPIRERAKVRE